MVKSLFHLYFRSSHHLYFIFLSRVKINSINWPAPNIWVFIAQLVEHCSANAEAMGSNPVEALKFFSGLNLQLLKLRLQLRWSNLYFRDKCVARRTGEMQSPFFLSHIFFFYQSMLVSFEHHASISEVILDCSSALQERTSLSVSQNLGNCR